MKCIAVFAGSPYLKYVLLIILVIQNAVLILSMRYSRIVEGEQTIMLVWCILFDASFFVLCSGNMNC